MTSQFFPRWNGEIALGVNLSRNKPLILAGPCMLESLELGIKVGTYLKDLCHKHDLSYVFKTSYDKANRTSSAGVRGPGIKAGLAWLKEIKNILNVPILVDVHSAPQALEAAEVADILQVPAFLCHQKDLLQACVKTGKVIQIKKGQWCSGEEMINLGSFLQLQDPNVRLILVERGSCFGYNNLVVDYRNMALWREAGFATVFDGTHSVQLPGALNGKSGGLASMVQPLVRAAVGMGVDGIFLEVHDNPLEALSDAQTQLNFAQAEKILSDISKLSVLC